METRQNFVNENSPSPEPFKEPEGLTTIDLNGGEYSEYKSDITKECSSKKLKQLRYVRCILWLTLIIFLAFLSLIIASILNKEYHIMKSKVVTSTNNDMSIEKNHLTFTTEKYIQNNPTTKGNEMFELCKVSRSFDDCCQIFIDSEYRDLVEFCTLNKMINLLFEFESSKRQKRQTFDYDYPDNLVPASQQEEYDYSYEYLDNVSKKKHTISNEPQHTEYNRNYFYQPPSINEHHETLDLAYNQPPQPEIIANPTFPSAYQPQHHDIILKPQGSSNVISFNQIPVQQQTIQTGDWFQKVNFQNYQSHPNSPLNSESQYSNIPVDHEASYNSNSNIPVSNQNHNFESSQSQPLSNQYQPQPAHALEISTFNQNSAISSNSAPVEQYNPPPKELYQNSANLHPDVPNQNQYIAPYESPPNYIQSPPGISEIPTHYQNSAAPSHSKPQYIPPQIPTFFQNIPPASNQYESHNSHISDISTYNKNPVIQTNAVTNSQPPNNQIQYSSKVLVSEAYPKQYQSQTYNQSSKPVIPQQYQEKKSPILTPQPYDQYKISNVEHTTQNIPNYNSAPSVAPFKPTPYPDQEYSNAEKNISPESNQYESHNSHISEIPAYNQNPVIQTNAATNAQPLNIQNQYSSKVPVEETYSKQYQQYNQNSNPDTPQQYEEKKYPIINTQQSYDQHKISNIEYSTQSIPNYDSAPNVPPFKPTAYPQQYYNPEVPNYNGEQKNIEQKGYVEPKLQMQPDIVQRIFTDEETSTPIFIATSEATSKSANVAQTGGIVHPVVEKINETTLQPKSIDQRANEQQPSTNDFRSKIKAVPLEDLQISQQVQSLSQPCFYPYPYPQMSYPPMYPQAPLRAGSPNDGSQLLRIVPMSSQPRLQPTTYMLNPPMYYSYPFQQAAPQSYPYNSYAGAGPVQASGPGGQYYMCNPIPPPAANVASVSGVEIRREAFNLQDLMENYTTENRRAGNKTRSSGIICPLGEFGCMDNSKCIKTYHVCDNEINCDDASDELFCSCKERVGSLRQCDGYCDCFDCEDEQGCFGCKEDEFSCDDWSRFRKSTCIPIDQRCDNVRHCEVTGKDEEDCSVLLDKIGNLPDLKVSNAVGYLHRNFRGKWYPTCFGTDLWAMEVCSIESGPSTIMPKSHMMLTTDKYDGTFINILPNNEISLVNTCVQDRAAFVECPPLYCGIRLIVKNMYRPHEVDTSVEDELNDLERNMVGQELLLNNETVGASRVVGGKASQPASWPWLVTIYKNGVFHCGGVLVNELWVVTAAHCVDKYWQYYYEIQAGVLRRFSFSPMEQTRWAVLAIAHESYNKLNLRNDVALMKLSAPLRYNRYVRPICLPSEVTAGKEFAHGPSKGTICTTVGWGATVEHGADPDHMREVEIPILKHCKHKEDKDVDEICAGFEEGGKDACQGDSGGPLMCRNPNNPSQWYLAGIVSHGEGCARPDEPGVYTRVSRYVGWIAENMRHDKFLPRIPLQKCPGYVCKGTNRCLPKKRHCDRIVDCLLGDDEENCETMFHQMFKHSRRNYLEAFRHSETSTDSNNSSNFILTTTEGTNNSTFEPTINENHNDEFFKCKIMLQIIPANLRCNKLVDCEDGTDEIDCSCADYVENINPGAICDGITDCLDLSDEAECSNCKKNEYFCRRSNKCINISKRCDKEFDCEKREDETDCAALTDGLYMRLDSDLRPRLFSSGIISTDHGGVWKPLCADVKDEDVPRVATWICNTLGFEEYSLFHKYHVDDKPLEIIMDGFNGTRERDSGRVDMCTAIYVKCANVTLDTSLHSKRRDNDTVDVELYTSPWNAAIYNSGTYKCMGTIIDNRWIVTSVNCFKGITILENQHVVALVGKGKANLKIAGPHEETLRIIESVYVGADIILLRTENNVTITRYARPAVFNVRRDKLRPEKCVATGLEEGRASLVFLQPIMNCKNGTRCFESKKVENCKDTSPWSGTIVCDSGNGWYPSAVFHEAHGRCGLGMVNNYTSLLNYKNKIIKTIRDSNGFTKAPPCDGFLCKMGNCIIKNKTCDGIPDCRGGEDESAELCYEREQQCHLTDECSCPRSQLKCANNKCLPKSAFCDRNNDCGNFEDEPDICSCAAYMKIAHPERLCDGVLHCADRTDEDPRTCPCKPKDFVCETSNLCVPRKMVCDGTPDCPDGEDEKECTSLKSETGDRSNVGEVMTQTAGLWHSGCHAMNYTTKQLEEMCVKLGFTGGSASQLPPPRDTKDLNSVRPVFDDFDVVWFRREKDNKFKLLMRTGNQPYVTLVPDETCFRLFIACL